ncbi:MAG TPA: DNA polymerase IV [Candidatus Acidoferrales bacterium]|nr:DNA polymerase IV [Candidatus Acidoferrales bacterium]
MPKLAQYRAKQNAAPVASPADAPSSGPANISILHVDMDAFFVSVELLDRPELRGLPVVVGGQANQRGVVTSASYEARRFGVHSAMPLRTAGKLCPHAVFLDNRHELYSQWSDRVATILAKYSPVVEMASIDEAYLDLTGTERLLGPALAAADCLLRDITKRTGLPCSGGLASTRLVAKVASDQAKPRGLVWVPEGAEEAFLALLSVRKIPGIGKVTEGALANMGIQTVAQLAAVTQERLEEAFGRWGTALYRKARGQDTYEFFVDAEPKSISHNCTFGSDTADSEILESTLSLLTQKAGKRLRDAGLFCRTVTVTLRFTNFQTITRSHTFANPADLDAVILAAVRELFHGAWRSSAKLRLVGVALSSFHAASSATGQLELLDAGRREKLERLAQAADRLRDRFGFSKIQLGGSLRPRGRS